MPALSTPFLVSIYCWFALEVGLVVRDLVRRKGRPGRDRGTGVIVSLSLAAAIWVGLAVRVWAVLTLRGSFSTFIQVVADQAVVTGLPYRRVRHPSYTGLLLVAL